LSERKDALLEFLLPGWLAALWYAQAVAGLIGLIVSEKRVEPLSVNRAIAFLGLSSRLAYRALAAESGTDGPFHQYE
jgi:hypothetical protein